MKNYNLTQTDYNQINRLIKLTSLIDDLYIKLYELEINNKKDTEEYNKTINYLNLLLEKENEKYKEYNLTQSKSLAWIEYLLEKKLPTNSKIDIETILNQDYSNKTIKRILNRLLCNVESCEINNNVLFSEVKKEIEKEGLELPEKFITHSITSSVRIRKALESDVFGIYLSFLAETITDKNFESIKRELIKSKYNFSFINKNVETSMISNNFGLDTTFYIGSKMIAELQYISPSLYTFFKDATV